MMKPAIDHVAIVTTYPGIVGRIIWNSIAHLAIGKFHLTFTAGICSLHLLLTIQTNYHGLSPTGDVGNLKGEPPLLNPEWTSL